MTVMWWYGGTPGWGGWLVMALTMLALWVVVVAAAVALWRGLHRGSQTGRGPAEVRGSDPRRVLDERFARGEIDEADYTRRRDLLGSGR